MISNGEGWHYLAVNKLSALLRRITSKHDVDFYSLNCFHSSQHRQKLELHKKICESKDFCNVIMPSEDIKILKFSQYQKFDNVPFAIHANL